MCICTNSRAPISSHGAFMSVRLHKPFGIGGMVPGFPIGSEMTREGRMKGNDLDPNNAIVHVGSRLVKTYFAHQNAQWTDFGRLKKPIGRCRQSCYDVVLFCLMNCTLKMIECSLEQRVSAGVG